MKLAIELSEDQRRRLDEVAGRLNVPAESLAEAAIRDLIDRPEPGFEAVAQRILEKKAPSAEEE